MLGSSAAEGTRTAGGYGPPGGGYPPGGGGGYGGPPGGPPPGGAPPGGGGYGPPGGGGYGGPPGGGGYGGPPGGSPPGGYGGPPQGPPPGYGPGFGPPGQGFGQGFGPGAPGPGGPKIQPLAIVSLVLGILSVPLCCCSLFGMWAPIGAIVCGIVAMNKIKLEPHLFTGNGLCIAGIVTGGMGLMLDLLAIFTTIDENLKSQYGHF